MTEREIKPLNQDQLEAMGVVKPTTNASENIELAEDDGEEN